MSESSKGGNESGIHLFGVLKEKVYSCTYDQVRNFHHKYNISPSSNALEIQMLTNE